MIPSRSDLDFDTGECSNNIYARASVIQNKLRVISNPWTGNKRKMIARLLEIIDKHKLSRDRVLDLFCGSAVVSMALKREGSTMIANDLLKFPYYCARAFVTNYTEELTDEDKAYLLNPADLDVTGLAWAMYDRRFTKNEARFIDTFSQRVTDRLTGMGAVIAHLSLLFHIMKHCYLGGRLNHGQVLADLDHRLNHDRNQGREMNFQAMEWVSYHENDGLAHKATNFDAIELLSKKDEVDLAYIDPPYGSQQSDYGKMYKFFENYLDPLAEEKPKEDHENRFTGKGKQYDEHFRDMLSAACHIPVLVFSYNSSSWSGLDVILDRIKMFRRDVCAEVLDYEYNYRDRSKKSQEYVIIAR